ncbi:hypothetical protein Cgig2_021563 [Carnegiea gigantea]|uniref:Beta-glucosidase n=1 Tax=Carnegiea gigantea TaxID=171969 RepID=A0A9Q1JSY8_9CARY|nr:hypothetical protein Cgig2_021563 [Carnegiea gigantea]
MGRSTLLWRSSLLVLLQVVAEQWAALAAEVDTGGLSRKSFPKGFVFGTATSAYQVEGMAHGDGRGPSIWDEFVKRPGIVANNGTGDVAVDQYHRYKEDVDIMANINMDAYRFSISWSRIFPKGAGEVNWKGVAYYNRLIDYLLERGVAPYANLYHYDLPLALEQKYKEFCFKTFGDRVKNWMTFNEPRVVAALGYDTGFFAPGRCSKEYGNCTEGNSGTEPYIAAHHLILSHAAAVQRYREKYQEKQKGRIGILLDFVWFLHPIVYGEYPRTMQVVVGERLPKFTEEEVKMVKGSMDFVGINQYTAYYMYNPPLQSTAKPPSYQLDWKAGFACMDDPGNVTLLQGLHDLKRINYYESYLLSLKKAIDDGANVMGYFAWSLLDNFEWRLGYTSRFGIVYVDYKDLKRYPKMSAYWFKQVLQRD